MHISLNSTLRRLLFTAVCVAFVGPYITAIALHYDAARLSARPDLKSLTRAVKLEPWNAAPRWRLGRYSLFVTQDSRTAISNLETAVALNPHVAGYWLDLAAAYQVVDDLQRQRSALEQAVHVEPTAPDVAWEVGNFYLVENDLHRALSLFRVVMANDPRQVGAVLNLCWRATHNVKVMLAEAVPPEPTPYFAFLSLLADQGQTVAAETVWNRLAGLGRQFPAAEAFPFFDYLIEKHQTAAAIQVWRELVNRNRELQSYAQPGNLVVDGGLERDFLNGGFDWRYSASDSLELSVDSNEFHSGNQSLRMLFKGPGVGDPGFMEYVPVQPNSDYGFSVYTKAEDIESASGPRLSVVDAYSGRSYVLTDDSLGTTGWREQAAGFHTAPDTSLVIVKVTRVPGDPLIKGKFWVDDVSLVER